MKDITLEELALMIAGGFRGVDRKCDEMRGGFVRVDTKIENLQTDMENRCIALEEKIQREFAAVHEELQGIHRALDSLSVRIIL